MVNQLSIEAVRRAVDQRLEEIISTRISEAAEVGAGYENLWRNIEKVATVGGKRIRPYLTVVGFGELNPSIIDIATAQELVHIAMLMHDDVIDQDFIRRGQKNINGLYRDKYSQVTGEPRATHYANSAGILAGDALLSEAYRLVGSAEIEEAKKTRIINQLGVSIFEVIGGELLDVEAAFCDETDFDPIKIYRYKTASYSFIGPILAGAYCRGDDDATIEILKNFASDLGIAFQIQDDLLGIYGDEAETGKSTVNDLIEGKRTLLVTLHQKAILEDEAMKERFQAFGDSTARLEQLEAIKLDMTISGARAQTTHAVENYFARAASHLQKLKDETRRTRLQELMSRLDNRRV